MNTVTEHKNILLIRSATRILNSTIESLKKEFPNSKITILAPESARKNLAEHPNVDAMISTKNLNRMTLFSLKRNTLREIRCGKFNLAISLYNIDHGMGYSNIDCIAWASGAKDIRGYNACGTYVEFKGLDILKKLFLEKSSIAWLILNGFITVILFLFITIGLLGEWTIRRILGRNIIEESSTVKEQPSVLSQNVENKNIPHGLPSRAHQKV